MKERKRGASAQLNSSHSSVTQPVAEGRNARRVQKIEALHLEFQDLKKKIKDVQNKNQKIIENIHKRYDFKKKPQTMESMVEESPIVYYEKIQNKSQVSAQNQSCNSNDSQCDYKIGKPIVRKTSHIKRNIQPGHQSMEYRKTQHNFEEREGSDLGSNKSGFNPPPIAKQMSYSPQYPYATTSNFRPQTPPSQQFQVSQYSGMPPYQMSMQFPQYPSMTFTQPQNFYQTNNYQFQQYLRREKEKIKLLQKELQEKEKDTLQLRKLQKQYKNLSLTHAQLVQSYLQDFMEQVVKRRFNEIEKYVKKNQNKLRKLHIMVKDKEEDNRSTKNIQEHRRKRSNSRNKKQSSPTNRHYSNLPRGPRKNVMTQPQFSGQSDTPSNSKSKVSDQSRSNIKFQQIASQYEEMIKTKNKELESFENKLKQKQRELIEMSAKNAKLELKLAEAEEIPRNTRRISSQREELLLSNLQFDTEKDQKFKQVSKKLSELQNLLSQKDHLLKEKDIQLTKLNKKVADFELKSKKHDNQVKKMKEQLLKRQALTKDDTELNIKLTRLESDIESKEKEITEMKEKCMKLQSEKIQIECQNMTFGNKIKKIEQLMTVKEEKIAELEKIIQTNTSNELPELLQRSVIVDKIQHTQMQNLQAQRQKLEEQLAKKDEELFLLKKNNESLSTRCNESQTSNEKLKKERDSLQIQNQSMKINLKAMEFQKYSLKNDEKSPLQKLLQENECVSENDDSSAVREELEEVRDKYEEVQRQLKVQKHESLEFNTKLIKINSELNYYKEQLGDREAKYEKLRKEFEENKFEIAQLEQRLEEKEGELQVQRKQNNDKIMELQTQWMEFQEEMRNKDQFQGLNNMSDLKNSRNFSEDSFIGYKNTFNNINAQNQHLLEKLKEYQKTIEVQKEMQEKIIKQYHSNVEIIKSELKQKVRTNENLMEELENMKRKVKLLEKNEVRLKQMSERGEKDVNQEVTSKIYVLQMQLEQLKEIKYKQEAVQQELFKQIAQKDQQNQSLMRMISSKDRKIEELEELIELKEMHFSSNISSSQGKSKIKESLHSNSSLRYSMLSNNPNNNKTIDFELSEAGESFYQHNQSMISNVSEVFNMNEFPYQKMHLKRVEQRRLFQKTAAYIKSLKTVIQEKNKKIKLLEKKIQSLRNSQLIRKDLFDIKQNFDLQPEDQDIFKDYYSVQNHSSSYQRHKFKQLQHETKLAIEENNLLINQIEAMQDELSKAEEQQNSLMKLKDLYKDEIKNLIKKNQQQAKTFEEEMKKERQKVEQNQSVQKMDALKQLYLKIMDIVTLMEHQGHKSKKKQQYKKQLQEYTKVFCNFLNVEENTREKILSEIRK